MLSSSSNRGARSSDWGSDYFRDASGADTLSSDPIRIFFVCRGNSCGRGRTTSDQSADADVWVALAVGGPERGAVGRGRDGGEDKDKEGGGTHGDISG